MKNLETKELKEEFRKNLKEALEYVGIGKIIFKFYTYNNLKLEPITILIGFSYIEYNNVCIARDYKKEDYDNIIKIILYNMNYSDFIYISTEKYDTGEQCHGFGEYWSEQTITFTYYRQEEEKQKNGI